MCCTLRRYATCYCNSPSWACSARSAPPTEKSAYSVDEHLENLLQQGLVATVAELKRFAQLLYVAGVGGKRSPAVSLGADLPWLSRTAAASFRAIPKWLRRRPLGR